MANRTIGSEVIRFRSLGERTSGEEILDGVNAGPGGRLMLLAGDCNDMPASTMFQIMMLIASHSDVSSPTCKHHCFRRDAILSLYGLHFSPQQWQLLRASFSRARLEIVTHSRADSSSPTPRNPCADQLTSDPLRLCTCSSTNHTSVRRRVVYGVKIVRSKVARNNANRLDFSRVRARERAEFGAEPSWMAVEAYWKCQGGD